MYWIILALVLPLRTIGIGQPHYECGEHGRFEYCIDGIPGCVVGCHCHPGYYFDVETKICEPNAKLVQDYRRLNYGISPTRVPELSGVDADGQPIQTTTSLLDLHVENIAKESDDLGDWLYNQFFKTIESQVINNTNQSVEKSPTRRSGANGSLKKKPKKRNRDKTRTTDKKYKKKSDLRRKLLRITEDDSLFDSNSDSADNSDSDSSGSETETDTSSDTDSESEFSGEVSDCPSKINCKDKDNNKDHKEFAWITKKAKPLPSFIFLPNIQTPFFPPIGPPMYPMVPIPPIMIMTSTATAETTTKKTEETKLTTTSKSTVGDETPSRPSHPSNPSNPSDLSDPSLSTLHKQIDKPITRQETDQDNNNGKRPFVHSSKRKKMLRQLHDQMKKNKNKEMTMSTEPRPDYEDSPMVDVDGIPMNQILPHEKKEQPHEDVDFKYLAQLIHKIDNKTKRNKENYNSSVMPMRKYSNVMNQFYPPPTDDDNGRRYFNNRRYLESPNDSYYTNLGQQIASLIRKIDGSSNDRRLGLDIDRADHQQQPIFSENTYAPRSYWERSVRSLLSRYRPYVDEYYAQKNHEESLFNLEKKVETVASTVKTLSLNEIENVIFLMDKSKSELQSLTQRPNTTTKGNDDNLNINLLPKQYENFNKFQKNSRYNMYYDDPASVLLSRKLNNSNIKTQALSREKTYNLRGVINFKNAPFNKYYNHDLGRHDVMSSNLMENMTEVQRNEIANLQRIVGAKLNEVANSRSQLPKVPWLAPKLATMLGERDINRIADKVVRNQFSVKYPINLRRNFPSKRLYADKNSRILHHKGILPIKVPIIRTSSVFQPQPSYFHHEIQHYDFFQK